MSNSAWIKTTIDVNESYFTVRGLAVILSHSQQSLCPLNSCNGQLNICWKLVTFKISEFLHEIEIHLQNMLRILRPQDILKMAVRLQNTNPNHARYLAIVSCTDKSKESALIGFDCVEDNQISIGLSIPLTSLTKIELDGEGTLKLLMRYKFMFLRWCSS